MNSSRIVFIESNTSGTGHMFLAAAAKRGLEPIVMARDPNRYSFAHEHVYRVDTTDTGRLIEACRNIHRSGRIEAILSSSEYYVAHAARCARTFGLPGADVDAVTKCRDKAYQREMLSRAGISGPEYIVVNSAKEAMEYTKPFGVPLVLKPRFGSGSIGVRLCQNEQEITNQANQLLSLSEQIDKNPKAGGFIVESYLDGDEYSVEIFDGQVIGITRKHLGKHPHFIETGHDYPATLSKSDMTALVDTALRTTETLGLDFGPVHVELRLAKGKASIIEVNPRLAGGFIPKLIAKATGIDLIEKTLDRALGKHILMHKRNHRWASIRFLLPTHNGRLVRLNSNRAQTLLRHDEEIEMYAAPDSRIQIHGDFRDRMGHAIGIGDNPQTAARQADSLLAMIDFDIEVEQTKDGKTK